MKFTKRCFLPTLFCFSTFSIVTVGNPESAHAWFKICNQSTQTVSAAFAYEDLSGINRDIFGSAPPQMSRGWTSEGWWNLKSGQCVQVYPHDLRDRNSFYYVYAKGDSGVVWEGKNPFCVTSSSFTLGFANGRCGGRGRFENFKEVDTGNSRNFTYRFTD